MLCCALLCLMFIHICFCFCFCFCFFFCFCFTNAMSGLSMHIHMHMGRIPFATRRSAHICACLKVCECLFYVLFVYLCTFFRVLCFVFCVYQNVNICPLSARLCLRWRPVSCAARRGGIHLIPYVPSTVTGSSAFVTIIVAVAAAASALAFFGLLLQGVVWNVNAVGISVWLLCRFFVSFQFLVSFFFILHSLFHTWFENNSNKNE